MSKCLSPDDVLRDPAASYWLKQAVQDLFARDPVDAVRDTEVLHRIMVARIGRQLLASGNNAEKGGP